MSLALQVGDWSLPHHRPEPTEPFPHTNDPNQYANTGKQWLQAILDERPAS